jgi:hypothetical protein
MLTLGAWLLIVHLFAFLPYRVGFPSASKTFPPYLGSDTARARHTTRRALWSFQQFENVARHVRTCRSFYYDKGSNFHFTLNKS